MDIKPISPAFSTTGQLQAEDLAEVAARGFRTVVCNRPDGEAPGQPSSLLMAAEAARIGLNFEYIPVEPGKFETSDARRLDRVLRETKGPVLGYCRTGARAEKLWQLAQDRRAAE